MEWNQKDMTQYIQAKEFVDTILVPLIPFHLSHDSELQKSAFQREVLSIFISEIEKELTGRVVRIPSYTYLKTSSKEFETERINTWVDDVEKQPFAYVFFLTFDSTWKKHEQVLKGNLLWLPGVQSGDIHSPEMHSLIRDQVSQISELIRSYW